MSNSELVKLLPEDVRMSIAALLSHTAACFLKLLKMFHLCSQKE